MTASTEVPVKAFLVPNRRISSGTIRMATISTDVLTEKDRPDAKVGRPASEGARVLLVTVEACSVSFCAGIPRRADIIGAALFGDGAAAACVTSAADQGHERQIVIDRGTQKIWPDTLSIMGWDVNDTSLGVIFDKAIPDFTREYLPTAVAEILSKLGKDADEIDRFVFHPGGTKVLQAIEQSLDLRPDYLGIERQVLRDFGNMSAPTVLFVLKRVLETEQKGDMLMGAFGPVSPLPFCRYYHIGEMSVSLPALLLLIFLVVQRLGELILSNRNTRKLLEQGATEVGAEHYPAMIALHAAWLIAFVWFGIGQALSLPWLTVFAVLQVLRIWIISSLGNRWTTRIIVLPEPVVTRGPMPGPGTPTTCW